MRIVGFSLLFILFSQSLLAQNRILDNQIPLKSALFANDIIIDNKPDRDQSKISICSAFNGWLYAIYSYVIGNQPEAALLRSKDNGLTWDLLIEGPFGNPNTINKRIEVISAGNSIDSFKIFLSYVRTNSDGSIGSAQVLQYKGEPLTGEGPIFYSPDNILDLTFSTDKFNPPSGANSYSLGLFYKKHINNVLGDSLVFMSAFNGGWWSSYKHVVNYTGHFDQLQLTYGKGNTQNAGRFYVTWQEKINQDSILGHIYTSHTEPNLSSAFSTPVCLDCSDAFISNKCRNPKIACLYGNMNNLVSNITATILFEHYISSSTSYNIIGYYNCNSTNTTQYTQFSLNSISSFNLQPDIYFNPFDSTFNVTYFDTINHKLPYLTNDCNLNNPNTWRFISEGYNDSQNVSFPYPKIQINQVTKAGFTTWISEGTNGNGIALFDAYDHYYSGFIYQEPFMTNEVKIYPNPCDQKAIILFTIYTNSLTSFTLFNNLGVNVFTSGLKKYSPGNYSLELNTQSFFSGEYIYRVKINDILYSGKLFIYH